jgi:PAS domain S-box-containing protein
MRSNPFPRLSSSQSLSLVAALSIILTLLEFFTAPEIIITALFLLPAVIAAWYNGVKWGLAVVVFLVLMRMFSVTVLHPIFDFRVHAFNAIVRLFAFGLITWVVARLSDATRRLEEWKEIFSRIRWGVCVSDAATGRVSLANPAFAEMHGFSESEILGSPIRRFVAPEALEGVGEVARKVDEAGHLTWESRHVRSDGSVFDVGVDALAVRDQSGAVRYRVVTVGDISGRKAADREREKLLSDLQEALGNVKMLSGLIPICGSCKKIRDDRGYWTQVEQYVMQHSEARFSHGICPDCLKRDFPEAWEQMMAKKQGGAPPNAGP